jgi:hypothetical protein
VSWSGPRLISFVGTDGAGKTTQAQLLARDLQRLNFKVRVVSVRGSGMAVLLLPLVILFGRHREVAGPARPFDTLVRELDMYLPEKIASGIVGKLVAVIIWIYALSAVTLRVKLPLMLSRNTIIITDRFLQDIVVDLAAFTGDRAFFERSLFGHAMYRCYRSTVIFLNCKDASKRKDDIPNSTYLARRAFLYCSLLNKAKAISVDTSGDISTTQRAIKEAIFHNRMPEVGTCRSVTR